ncbi:sulfurtransferase TusA family protein [Volucribacter amazonae]|uniref:UPF0033 domain-containing protein n=1 Tax=Volucribacter amazonae TaxID=256731 RepID=A0A9X4SIG5_9PAST|nr:sulfurtransferase TusA family protein [Volucribacter amazonae]MDG6895632.1 hypothetical protein [Volucribacter amazonae]
MQYQLDLRQYRCPLPLLMTKQALGHLNLDDELILWLSPASAVQDFEGLCRQMGYRLQIVSAKELKIQKIC